jgi:hypothetical protein
MASNGDESAPPALKKRAANGDLEDDDFGPGTPKKAKLDEEDSDDFGPAMPTSDPTSEPGTKGDDAAVWARIRAQPDEISQVSALDSLLSGSDRAEWMTMLPAERQQSRELDFGKMQQNVTTFTKRGIQRRGDTSSWTDTPQDRADRDAGKARMSSLDMAKQLAAERFKKEEQIEARASVAAFNSEHRSMSLYEQVKSGAIQKEAKEESDSETSDSSGSSSDSERKRSHKHKKSKDKHKHKRRDKDKHKDKDRHKHKDKSKDKGKDKRLKYDEQTPRALSTGDAHKSSGAYWDRERDLERFGSRASEQKRVQTFRDAALLNSRFYSGGTKQGPSNLR